MGISYSNLILKPKDKLLHTAGGLLNLSSRFEEQERCTFLTLQSPVPRESLDPGSPFMCTSRCVEGKYQDCTCNQLEPC